MAEVLVKLIDASHPDPTIDQSGCYKAGMPVLVIDDGHVWGRKECPPLFFVARFPGVSKATLSGYVQEQVRVGDYAPNSNKIVGQVESTVAADGSILTNDGVTKTLRRREWQIQISQVSAEIQSLITTQGYLTVGVGGMPGDVTWEQMRMILFSHRLGFTERRAGPRS